MARRVQGLADDGSAGAGGALDDPTARNLLRLRQRQHPRHFNDTVAAHAAYLAANPNTVVIVEGHADERGSREYNLALGERRSLAVRKQLVLLGAPRPAESRPSATAKSARRSTAMTKVATRRTAALNWSTQ